MLALDRRVPLGHGALALKALGRGDAARRACSSRARSSRCRSAASRRARWSRTCSAQHMSLAMDARQHHGAAQHVPAARPRAPRAATGSAASPGYAEAFEALDVPLLVIAGTKDDLAPPASSSPAYRAQPLDATRRTASFPRGHIDLIVGRDAPLDDLAADRGVGRARRASATGAAALNARAAEVLRSRHGPEGQDLPRG